MYRTGPNEHAIITALEGIEQGDAAGPALFACGLKTPLDELRIEVRRLIAAHIRGNQDSEANRASAEGNSSVAGRTDDASENCAVFAYLDDTIVGVPPEIAEAALSAAIDIFARAGHTVHPGKSGCWSLGTQPHELPASCQRIWHEHGLLKGGMPVYDEAKKRQL